MNPPFEYYNIAKHHLQEALEYLQKYQDDTIFQSVFGKTCNRLRESGFILIPTNQKKPRCKFETQAEKERANKIKIDTEAGLLLPPWLAVLDIDNPELFCSSYQISLEELREIATVQTRKGYHIYLFDPEGRTQFCNLYLSSEGWELRKGENLYIIMPGSRIGFDGTSVIYRILNPRIYSYDDFPFKEIFQKIQAKSSTKQQQEEREQRQHEEKIKQGKINLEKLKELLKKHYIPGQRQNLCIFGAGFLLKQGLKPEQVLQFFEEFVSEMGDEELKDRIRGVKHTITDFEYDERSVKGYQGLLELGITEEEIKECIQSVDEEKNILLEELGKYVNVQGLLFKKKVYTTKEGEKEILQGPFGPYFKIVSRIIDEERNVSYEISSQGDTFVIKNIKDIEEIQSKTGFAIISNTEFMKWLNLTLATKTIPVRYVRSRTGWQDDMFLHPLLQPQDIWPPFIQKLTQPQPASLEILAHNELITRALKEGKILGLLYVCAVSNILVKKIQGVNPFVVLVTGPSGTGKTTACWLATQLFYNLNEPFSANATQVGVEFLLKPLQDLPVLFDEMAVSYFDLEKMVFMTTQKRGRIRGTKHLTISFADLYSTLFLTSEIFEQEAFQRTGSFRRILPITISSWEDVSSSISLDQARASLHLWGAGVAIINFLLQNLHIITEISQQAEQILQDWKFSKGIYTIAKTLVAGALLLEKAYGMNFPELFQTIQNTLSSLSETFEEKRNQVDRFIEEFSQFLVKNHNKIYQKEADPPRGEIIGEQAGSGEYYILTEVFQDWARQAGFHLKILLQELEKAKILLPSGGGLRKRKRILGQLVSAYHLNLENYEVKW
jgi:hypothetical protein